ncbi:MAG: MBL fold metallo-hydrolase [Promethearchaeota archaeon]
MPYSKITKNIFAVGGSTLSNSGDAISYLIKTKEKSLVLFDCGADSREIIIENIKDTGSDPDKLEALILSHGHIDHAGSAFDFKQKFPQLKIYAHEWEKPVLEGKNGTEKMTAADWYGLKFKPIKIDEVLTKVEEKHTIGGTEFLFVHTPGHTPGSISVIVEDDDEKVLFGQDIHGPFEKIFNSNIKDWIKSMKLLLSKECSILCEGHFGIYRTPREVEKYIKGQLNQHRF